MRNLLGHRCGLNESLYGLATVVPVAVPLDAEAIRRRVPAQICRPGDFGHLLLMGPVAPLAPEPPVCMIPVSSARQGLRIRESYRSRSGPPVLRPESNAGLVGWLVRQVPDTSERARRSRAQAWPL